MRTEHLQAQVERLNRSTGVSYRIMLAGLLALHSRKPVVQALAGSWSGNVVSIATSTNWCRPTPRHGNRAAG
jgi:hypothetical protein